MELVTRLRRSAGSHLAERRPHTGTPVEKGSVPFSSEIRANCMIGTFSELVDEIRHRGRAETVDGALRDSWARRDAGCRQRQCGANRGIRARYRQTAQKREASPFLPWLSLVVCAM